MTSKKQATVVIESGYDVPEAEIERRITEDCDLLVPIHHGNISQEEIIAQVTEIIAGTTGSGLEVTHVHHYTDEGITNVLFKKTKQTITDLLRK
jgi:hypothetical protein